MEERLAELLVEIGDGTATVTLNRPAALNALSFGMLEGLASHLDAWEDDDSVERIVFRGAGERAFCAGGDIRSLYHGVKVGSREPLRFMEVEYALDLRIHEYRKPIAALIDGIVMGGGMGISQGAGLRVVGDRTRMAMPETVIGLFPDVGGSYFLSRVPGKVGFYLGLVGPTIDAADALYCGLADIYLDRAAVDDFDFATAQAKGRSTLPGSGLERLRPAIDEHFSQPGVPEIMASLRREDREPYRAWAGETLTALERRSPTMLDVTFEQVRRGATMSIAECLRMELHLIERAFEHGDLLEGIRALIIDKDNQPDWKQRVAIEHFFNQGETMKLVTYSTLPAGQPRPGLLLDDKRIVDIQTALDDELDSLLAVIRGGSAALDRLKALAAKPPATTVLVGDVRLHAPIPRPVKNVFCVGWNYLEHFEEGAQKLQEKRELPKHPVFFSKATTAVNGPFDAVPFDASISTSLDWEVELGVVIGTTGKNISEADAMKHIFGYTVINDVSWRDLQRRHGGQWHKGKSLDGTCPMGPSIVTADSLDPTNLRVTCRVNGVVKQDSYTRHMYFKIPRLIAELSAGMTLEAGDIISTGTPEGVGFARTPAEFMKPGDLLETEIEGIGTIRNPID